MSAAERVREERKQQMLDAYAAAIRKTYDDPCEYRHQGAESALDEVLAILTTMETPDAD